MGERNSAITFATKLAKRCNALSCFEASAAMQKQEQTVFRRLHFHRLV
ncbi:hypothetical protein [Planomicrobium soli]|nr:hypothetical protein [Planomicrobium soli]